MSYSKRIYFVCCVLFILSLGLVKVDKSFSDFIHWNLRPWQFLIKPATLLGDGWVLMPACGIAALFFWIRKSKLLKFPFLAALGFISSGLVVQWIKIYSGRPRPYLFDEPANRTLDFGTFYGFTENTDFRSFPSGHSAAVFSVAWVFLHLPLQSFTPKTRRIVRGLVLTLAVIVAMTRVMLGKHFLADVIAGASLGIFFSTWILKRFRIIR